MDLSRVAAHPEVETAELPWSCGGAAPEEEYSLSWERPLSPIQAELIQFDKLLFGRLIP
jgi:hypothetical protein